MLRVLEVVLWLAAMSSAVWSVLRHGDWLPEVFVALSFTGISIITFATEGPVFYAYFAAFVAAFSYGMAWVNFQDRGGQCDHELPDEDPDLGRI